ncbi:MAG TPA: ATP-binding cassette domain-containing protein, partial [Fimbriimonadaceae bacterium]|nr:ATP-binding cassette domain-containing protein [Fimbriimonadaceae bacterium]
LIVAAQASLVYHDHGREVYAVRHADLEVRPGEFLGILGPSGSGKSSLLYLLSGLKMPTEGSVCFAGKDMSRMSDEERSRLRLRRFGFVFQQPYLLGYLTAIENVIVAASSTKARGQGLQLLAELGLADKTHRYPHELSGGERQRVCVARALLGSPSVVFADEPTASLDHKNGASVVHLLNHLRGDGALVMVTHDPSMLEEASRIVRLVDGRIEEDQYS